MAAKKILKKEPAPSSVSLIVPQADPELSNSAKRMLAQAQAIEVTTAVEYEEAAVVLQNLTQREKEVEARKAEVWDPLAKLTKAVQALFNPPLKVLDQAKKTVSGKMGVYALEQRNIAIAKQQEADDAAEAARQKLLDKAERATDDGNHARAVVLEARAESIQAPTIETDIPKVSGIQLRERWLFEVADPLQLPRAYLTVDESAIRNAVNVTKGAIKIPGVRIWSTLKPQG